MGQSPGDDKNEPSLELPPLSLRGLARRKRRTASAGTSDASPAGDQPAGDTVPGEPAVEDPAPADVPRDELPTELPTQPHPVTGGEPTSVIATPDVPTAAEPPHQQTTTLPAQTPERPQEAPVRRAERPGTGISLPVLPGRLAAAVTGLAIGGAGAAATYAAMAGCEAVRGVSTCGEAPGFFILIAILVVMVLLGTVVLKALQVGDPTSTSFLAVGIVTVVVMLVLLDVIFSPWMFVVIPLLGAAAFVLSHWVTNQFGEETGRPDWS